MTDLTMDFMERGIPIPQDNNQYTKHYKRDIHYYILDTMETIMEIEEEFRSIFYVISIFIVYFTFIICSVYSLLNGN
jgi:hypothetical protein